MSMSTQDTDLIFPSNTEVQTFMKFLSSLLAYLLTCWLLPTTTQVTIESVPSIAVEGETVLLFVHSLPPNILAFYWYRGVRALRSFQIAEYVIATKSCVEGPSHRGRETVLSNGSLLIKSVTRQDSGHYTLQIITTNARPEIIRAEFFVHSKSIFCELCCW